MSSFRRTYRILILLSITVSSFAQRGDHRIETYTTRQGLSHNETYSLYKDSRGLLWIGTEFGLNMFDGNTFTHFFNIPGDTNSLPHNKVVSITEDRQQQLWIGTIKGVSRLDLLNRRFVNYSPLNHGPYHFDGNECKVYVAADNTIWIGSDKGVVNIDPATRRKSVYLLALAPPGQHRNKYASAFLEDRKGNIWVATSWGVYRKGRNENSFRSFRFPQDHPGERQLNACTILRSGHDGTIYCGTWHGGLIYFSEKEQCFRQLPVTNGRLSLIFDMLISKERVWATGIGGVSFTDTKDLLQKKDTLWSLLCPRQYNPQLTANRLLQDGNTIWIATNKGLMKVVRYDSLFTNYSYANINTWNTLSIIESPSTDSLVILNGLNLFTYSFDRNAATNIMKLNGKYAWQMVKTAHGYAVTQTPGLVLFDGRLKAKEKLEHKNKNGKAEYFGELYQDNTGVFWMSSAARRGIRTYDPATREWRAYLDDPINGLSISGRSVNCITGDEYGNIWIASTPLIRYNRKERKFESIPLSNKLYDSVNVNSTECVHAPGNGIVWIGSNAGLYCYDYRKNTTINIPLPANMSSRIDGIIADRSGHLWLSSAGNLVSYDIDRNSFRKYDEEDGFSADEMSWRFGLLKNGNIVVGYNGGFSVIDPSGIRNDSSVAIPQFTELTIDSHHQGFGHTPVIAYDQSINFNFVSPYYGSNEKNQYAYMLEPLDNKWNLIGANTSQRFANLPAGTYTFRVKAANASGNWNETANSFIFIVTPPFWKTWWFVTVIIATIAATLYVLYRYRLNQLLKIERLRTNIATDLHDDIGATLSAISMYSEAIKEQIKGKLPQLEPVLEKIGANSRSMVSNMGDIVWAINPDNDEGGKLVQRMQSHARDICAVQQVQLIFSANDRSASLALPLNYRKNIYLIFKEALNNTLKYANPVSIHIDVQLTGRQFRMTIQDDGTGFDIASAKKGNGLDNMQLRAGEINGTVHLFSALQKGTAITLNCIIP